MSGIFEVLLILAIIVVLFGASRLPALGGAVGKMVRNFKNSSAIKEEIQVIQTSKSENKNHHSEDKT